MIKRIGSALFWLPTEENNKKKIIKMWNTRGGDEEDVEQGKSGEEADMWHEKREKGKFLKEERNRKAWKKWEWRKNEGERRKGKAWKPKQEGK